MNGTAQAGKDFIDPGAASVPIPASGTASVSVDTTDDTEVEGTETFTVRLFNASNVSIGTGTATVTINDNDNLGTVNITGATVTEGVDAVVDITLSGGNVTGTVNYETVNGSASAPSDYTTTTGALTFTPTTPKHQVRVPTNDDNDDEGTETFTVRLFNASNVSIGTGTATVHILDDDDPDPPQRCQAGQHAHNPVFGSGSHPPGLSGTDAHRIAHGGGNPATGCFGDHTATAIQPVLSVSRPAGPVTECPSRSGQELVNGVCVPACSADLIPQFDNDGQVTGCIALGDCPFEMYGTTAADVARRGRFWFWPRWLDGPQDFSPVAAGESGTLTRRVVKCENIWGFDPFGVSQGGVPDSCIWRETNIGLSDGDCLRFSLSVEAVVPEVEDTNNQWSYTVRGCGHNKSADRQASTSNPWEEDDRNCNSADGQWARGYCTSFCGSTPTGIDAGDWTVTLGGLTKPRGSFDGSPYVDVPLVSCLGNSLDI